MSKKLVLIDGANCIFRAFFALPVLNNSKGLPTNALLGFSQMMLKLMRDEKPDFAAVVFDTKEPTFRDELFDEYKANRKEPPDDLIPQFEHFPKIVEALGLKSISKKGFEADDVIGTLAKRFSSDDLKVKIVSSDKDLYQLVNDNVVIFDSMKGKIYGVKEVEEKMGVPPEKVIEILALAGDPSDNIPGVRGIGLKTAQKLILEFGSVENLIEKTDMVRGSAGEKIKQNKDDLVLSKKLVTIDSNVPVETSLEDLKYGSYDRQKLIDLFEEFEFKRLIINLENS